MRWTIYGLPDIASIRFISFAQLMGIAVQQLLEGYKFPNSAVAEPTPSSLEYKI